VYVTGDPFKLLIEEKVPHAFPLQSAPDADQFTPR
jgi:hypothetical protein